MQYPRVGQNWAYKGRSRPPSTTRSYDSFIQGWYDEVKDYPAANAGALSNEGTTGVTGHYTQVVESEYNEYPPAFN